jgi:hypothetical protein
VTRAGGPHQLLFVRGHELPRLEYIWLRWLMKRYEDFWDVTGAALRSAAMQLKIEAKRDRLMQAFLRRRHFEIGRPLWTP